MQSKSERYDEKDPEQNSAAEVEEAYGDNFDLPADSEDVSNTIEKNSPTPEE